jgi:hypothetical protein
VERIPGDHLNIVTTKFEGPGFSTNPLHPAGFSSAYWMGVTKSGAMTFLRPAQF